MQAMLLQRIMVQKWSIVFILIVCLCLHIFNLDTSSIGIAIVIFSTSIISSMYITDRKVNWQMFVNSLPISKKVQLQADFLYSYSYVALLSILLAPSYFAQSAASENFIEHFSMYCAYSSSAILIVAVQLYVQQLEETKSMRDSRLLVAMFLIFAVVFALHFYLSLVAAQLFIILVPTFISIIISLYIFRKCVLLYQEKECL
ncbi:ABC-2 transporter permease [Lysinibacillus piscis]|uniref:ABC-2 transporter permease n=1 Tax=Lysinibacillus piscis TaxID=2518931 RepID=A0ABQ5NGU7_9BACI|nr:ABC-2 transporter permease [Lysinibacillus sp. KH24]GLC87348.1 hypothetical protein LYSBPC_04750 [Lysinibacillus sp. KH24]